MMQRVLIKSIRKKDRLSSSIRPLKVLKIQRLNHRHDDFLTRGLTFPSRGRTHKIRPCAKCSGMSSFSQHFEFRMRTFVRRSIFNFRKKFQTSIFKTVLSSNSVDVMVNTRILCMESCQVQRLVIEIFFRILPSHTLSQELI